LARYLRYPTLFEVSDVILISTSNQWFQGNSKFKKSESKNTMRNLVKNGNVPFLKVFENSSELYHNKTEIYGGANYFCFDKKYNGLCQYQKKHGDQSRNFPAFFDSEKYVLCFIAQQKGNAKLILRSDILGKKTRKQNFWKVITPMMSPNVSEI
jgi:hypothetical protein